MKYKIDNYSLRLFATDSPYPFDWSVPASVFLVEGKVGILEIKSDTLLSGRAWKTFFYMHITFIGLALLVGWVQFNKYVRERYR